MSSKYTTIQQHEPLRVPSGWGAQEKRLIAQLEETFDDLYSRFNRLKISDLGQELQKTITESADGVSQINAEIVVLSGQIELKASQSDVNALTSRVSQAEIDIDGAEAAIALKASQSDLTALTSRVSQAEIDIDGVEAAIALKASQSDVTALASRVSQAEIDIDGAEAAIALKASKATVDNILDGTTAVPHVDTSTVVIDSVGVYIDTGGIFTVESGNFSIDANGNVVLIGTVTASAGAIGGWTLADNLLYSGSSTGYIALDSNTSHVYAVWAGNETAANAPFSVSRAGEVKAVSGTIGGWTLSASKLSSGSGSSYTHMSTTGDYAFLAGSETESSAPFRVKRDGTVYLTKLVTLNEQGNTTTVDLQNYPFWKLWYHTIKSYDSDSITLSNGATINFNSAAQTYLDSEWVGNTYNYYVKDQNDQTILSGSITLTPSPAQTGTTGPPLTNFNAEHKMAISVSATGIQGPLFYWGIDASGEYDAGVTAGQNSVSVVKGTWSSGQISFSTSAGTGLGKSVQLSQGTVTWDGNTASFSILDGQGSTGYTCSVDASARYTAGQNSVSVTKGTWSGGQIGFSTSAGSGAGKTVQLSKGMETWDGNSVSFPILDGQSSTGYTCSVDVSARYNAGVTAGKNAVTITKGTWSSGQISFTKSEGTASTKTVQLSQGTVTWDGNTASFSILDGSDSTGCTCSVDASARYNAGVAAGKNAVTITKGAWSGGQISFTKSEGTASTKTVQLSKGTETWDGDSVSFPILDGQGSTGYTCTVNAQARYNAGYSAGYAAGWAAAKALISVSDYNKIKGPPDTVDGAAVTLYTITAGNSAISIVNNAPGYYTASGQAYAYINGNWAAQNNFSKTQHFS